MPSHAFTCSDLRLCRERVLSDAAKTPHSGPRLVTPNGLTNRADSRRVRHMDFAAYYVFDHDAFTSVEVVFGRSGYTLRTTGRACGCGDETPRSQCPKREHDVIPDNPPWNA